MMKTVYTSFVLLLLISLNACKSSETPVTPPDPVGTFKVMGTVLLNGEPVQGAIVGIDNVLNWKATTGSDGTFEINGVTNGNHLISASKTLEESKVVFQSSTIVTENPENNIGYLDLPLPVTMHNIEQGQITPFAIPLSWARTVNSDFIEYKLYRKDNPGLDEATGELIHTTSDISDTSFTDSNFRTGKAYYYRVYAYHQDGKHTGSNIVSVSVPELNLVQNPDFEVSSTGILPDQWLLRLSGTPEFNYFDVTDDNVKSGNYSLKVTYIDSLTNPDPGYPAWGGIGQTINTSNLNIEQEYTISFWTRVEIGNIQVRLVKNGDFEQPVFSYIVPTDQEWTEHRINFRIDAETSYLELWINTRAGFAVNGRVGGWIDNVKILK